MTTVHGANADPSRARDLVAGVRRWYHTMELAPGVLTPGLFDLRPIVGRLPWPDVRGRRCLDVGTSDGFLAFELERRDAAEVVAVDIPSHESWDWEVESGEGGVKYLHHVEGPAMGAGFAVAHELLGSRVRYQTFSVYELTPDALGRFDIVVCGSLLLHLRDPLRALAAIRSVCTGQLLCTNQVDLRRSVLDPRRPLIRLDGTSGMTQWWLPTPAGNRQMLRATGFEPRRETGLYAVPYGIGHPPAGAGLRPAVGRMARRWFAGSDGVPHHAVLAE